VPRVSPSVLGLAGVTLKAPFSMQFKLRTVERDKQGYGDQVSDGMPHGHNWGENVGNSLGSLALLSEGACLLLVFFTDLVEFLHVLEEFGASLKSNEELCLLAVSTVVGGLHSNRLGFDL
jgi:hypothetical protein